MFLSAFVSGEKITVHASGCSHVVRDWRKYGTPLIKLAESKLGLVRQLKASGIRIDSVRVMPCAGIPEGFWSLTPTGERLRLLSTESGAKTASKRLERQILTEARTAINDMSPYLREMLGLTQMS